MPIFMKKRAILAKIEAVYGTDPVPVAANDGVLLRNLTVTPLELGYAEREQIREFYGRFQQLPTTKQVKLEFEMEMAGFGTAGPAAPTPGYDALLRACAFARTVTVGTKVDYTPISSAIDSATLYYYHDGRLHKATGARGSLSMVLKRNEIPVYKFSFMALDGGIVDAALVAPTLAAYQVPLPCTPLNTTPFTIHGLATAGLQELTIDLGNKISYRNLINSTEQQLITDREPGGNVEIEDTLVATKDWWTNIKAATLGSLDITHGTVAGNMVQITSNNVQLTEPKFNEVDGIAHLQMGLRVIPTGAGNNEITISVK